MFKKKSKELYQIAVGEMGISLTDYKRMTEEEITLAYQGFLNNKINDANLLLSVLRKYKDDDYSKITLSFEHTTKEEREETFRDLGI